MPVTLRETGFTFFFFSNEGDPREPPHIHVRRGGGLAKFWLRPVTLATSRGFDPRALSQIELAVARHSDRFTEAWNEYFGDGRAL